MLGLLKEESCILKVPKDPAHMFGQFFCYLVAGAKASSISLVQERPIDWNFECECGRWVNLPYEVIMATLDN